MPRNVYFSAGAKSEQRVLEDIIIESIKIMGQDVYYIPRKMLKVDTILNEDVLSCFEKAFKIEMYIESVDGFEGDGKFISKFGLEIRDQVTLVVARKRWTELVGNQGYTDGSIRPREGDLIYFPLSTGLFEIRFVEDKMPFFQLNNTPTFKLTCELFELRHENISTGIKEIDDVQTTMSNRWIYTIQQSVIEPFFDHESVTITLPSGITGSATVLGYNETDSGIHLSVGALSFDDGNVYTVTPGTTFVGTISGATGDVESVVDLNDTDDILYPNDVRAQNSSFEIEAAELISFDESNPFGDT